MRNALFIIVSAGILVLLYPLLHERSTFLKENFRSYNFGKRFLSGPEIQPESTNLDSVQVLLSSNNIPDKPLYSGSEYLSGFFSALLQNGQQTRIAYYGDSSIEGDLITQTVRDSLQKVFGGSGVGFVPVTTHLKGFRRSVYFHFSEDWRSIKMNKPAPAGMHFGYMGTAYACRSTIEISSDTLAQEALTKRDSTETITDTIAIEEPLVFPLSAPDHSGLFTVKYTASKAFPGTNTFPSARLFYSCPVDSFNQKGSVKIIQGDNSKIKKLKKDQIVNDMLLLNYPSRNITLEFDSICNQVIYGLSFESNDGVILDNLAFRGNSGIWLTRIRSGVLRSFHQKLGVDLVVLQFGLNVLNAEMKDYRWYASDMKRVINHVRKGFPEASILVIGPADKSIKVDGKMKTDPSIPLITNTLRSVAETEKVAFFSFFEAMGGNESMVRWVNNEPRMANLDYTHFNAKGAEKAGKLLLSYLLEAFENYIPEQPADAVPF